MSRSRTAFVGLTAACWKWVRRSYAVYATACLLLFVSWGFLDSVTRFEVTASDRTSRSILAEYLRRLPQPVALPTDRRLVPNR